MLTTHEEYEALQRDAREFDPFAAMTDEEVREFEEWLDSLPPALDAEAAAERMDERERLEGGADEGGDGEYPW